jgi:hypothetical protein
MLVCAALVQAQSKQAECFVMVREAGKPAQKCRVLKCWKDKEGNKLCQVQAVDGGEIMTILEPTPSPGVPPARGFMASTLFHWGDQTTPPKGAPVAPNDATVMATAKPPSQSSLWDRMFGSSRSGVTTAVVTPAPPCVCDRPTRVVTSTEPPRAGAMPARTTCCEPPKVARVEHKPAEGQQPVSKAEHYSTEETEKAAQLASARAEDLQPKSKPTTEEPEPAAPAPAVAQAPPPPPQPKPAPAPACAVCNDPKKAPAQTPDPERRWLLSCLFSSKNEKSTQTVASPPAPVVIVQQPAPAAAPTVVEAKPESSLSTLWARVTGRIGSDAPVAGQRSYAGKSAGPTSSDLPPGMRAAMAASSPKLGEGMPRGPSVSASAPNAFTVVMPGPAGAQTQPMAGQPGNMMPPMMMGMAAAPMPPMMSQAGVPDGVGNAFTLAGTSRPIPADLTQPHEGPNAFYQSGGMGGAENRPVLAAGYYQQPMMMAPGMVPVAPTATRPSPAPFLLMVLRESVMPSEREMAAAELSRCDWRRDPNVVQGLVQAASTDPAPAVRASCVHALGQMKVNTVSAVTAVMALKQDGDIRVRQEVEQALAVMTAP